jgi:hypothetical protein
MKWVSRMPVSGAGNVGISVSFCHSGVVLSRDRVWGHYARGSVKRRLVRVNWPPAWPRSAGLLRMPGPESWRRGVEE